MIRIFYGDDRVTAQKMVVRQLGEDYEAIEAENLTANDMPSLLLGVSLHSYTRDDKSKFRFSYGQFISGFQFLIEP